MSGVEDVTDPFTGELTRVAETLGVAQFTPIIARLRRPVRVAVLGRPGVGRGRVEAALRHRGVPVAPSGADADVDVLVIAETAKPEELVVARSARRPLLILLTKADLAGAGPGGPIAVARRRAVAVEQLTAVPVIAVVGLLAALECDGLDPELLAALRVFVTEPPDLTGVEVFVEQPHPVERDVRARLLARLDRFGIAHAVLALAGGTEPQRLGGYLSALGNLDEVIAALETASARVRYLRLHAAVVELHALAARSDAVAVSDLLADDVTVLATMGAAVEVIEAAGLSVDRGDTAAAHLDRAIRWRRYCRGPVNDLHRRCGADIARGSLRLLARIQ
ncbi:hypothetical protein TUM20983_51910 [Mycobacterium antarcticum]|nr:hypothetical protein TUM20983_51910 [Mycolicibacterium sp. TUM20983]